MLSPDANNRAEQPPVHDNGLAQHQYVQVQDQEMEPVGHASLSPQPGESDEVPSPTVLAEMHKDDGDESNPSTSYSMRATDVVIDGAEGEGSHQADLVEVPPRRRLRMGDVYPIMKHTIYSDEECDGEVQITRKDCGARFILYVNTLFQYLVRNPKVMGLLLTTVILILFFKYSQQVVLKAVNTALNTHPGLNPSEELKSSAISFASEMTDFTHIAATLAWVYTHDRISGWNISSFVSSTLLTLLSSFQESFTSNTNTYVLYQLPLSPHWGKVGCQASHDVTSSPQTLCMYTTENSTLLAFQGTNTSAIKYTLSNMYFEKLISGFNETTLAAEGATWLPTRQYHDDFYNQTYRVLTYLLPFTTATGATAFAGVDVSLTSLANAVTVTTENAEVIVTDTKHYASKGGAFVVDTFDKSLFWDVPHAASETPCSRVNEIVQPIAEKRAHMPSLNFSFYEDGLIYQSLSMLDRYWLMASSPLALSAGEIKAAFGALLDLYEHLTSVAASAFSECETSANNKADNNFIESIAQIENIFGTRVRSLYVAYELEGTASTSTTSTTSTSTSPTSTTTTTTVSPEDTTTTSTTSTSTSTTPAPEDTTTTTTTTTTSSTSTTTTVSPEDTTTTSTTSTSTSTTPAPEDTTTTTTTTTTTSSASPDGARTVHRRTANLLDTATEWGGCGCSYDKATEAYVCFYTNSNSEELLFNGSAFSTAMETSTLNFTTTRRYQFIQQEVVNLTNTDGGFWTTPYFAYDSITKAEIVAMSYVLPFRYDAQKNVKAAAVFDLALDWVPAFLSENTPDGTTGLFLIDRRNSGVFMGSRGFSASSVCGAMNTSNATINKFTTAVYERAGSFDLPISFHIGEDLINYQLIEPYWGVLEVIPAAVALKRYLPTPTVTSATDALRLIPTSQTIELFLYVGGILFAYFLNLLILGCSKIGQTD